MSSNPRIRNRQSPLEMEAFWLRAILYKLIYSICGLVIGLACTIGGIILLLSKAAWTASGSAVQNKLFSAAPWAVLFVVGLFIIIFTSKGLRQIGVPQDAVSETFWKRINTFALVYSTCGLISGSGGIIGGVFLSLNAIAGNAGGTEFIIKNVVGAILLFVGCFVIILTRYNVISKEQLMRP